MLSPTCIPMLQNRNTLFKHQDGANTLKFSSLPNAIMPQVQTNSMLASHKDMVYMHASRPVCTKSNYALQILPSQHDPLKVESVSNKHNGMEAFHVKKGGRRVKKRALLSPPTNHQSTQQQLRKQKMFYK